MALQVVLSLKRSQLTEGSFRPSSIPPRLANKSFCMLGCCHSVIPATLQHILQLSALVLLHLILSSSSSVFSCAPLPASWHPFSLSICIILWIIPSVSSCVSVLFVLNPLKVWALKHRLSAGLVFSCECPIPLFVFCHSSAFMRSCYCLFCDTVWDYSHPKFELPPNYMCICCLCAYLTLCTHFCPWRIVDGSKTHSCISSLPTLHMDECGSSMKFNLFVQSWRIFVPLMFGNKIDVRFPWRTLKLFFGVIHFFHVFFAPGKTPRCTFSSIKVTLETFWGHRDYLTYFLKSIQNKQTTCSEDRHRSLLLFFLQNNKN